MELLSYINSLQELFTVQITNEKDLKKSLEMIIDIMGKMDAKINVYLIMHRNTIHDTLLYSIKEDGFIYLKDIVDFIEHSLIKYFKEKDN